MDGQLLILIEGLLIFGGVVAFALWEIWAVRRNRKG